ncbi:MAG: VacB/RNase II family 3'-5' exoribonuclease [Spongiibacteraceae bacterium]
MLNSDALSQLRSLKQQIEDDRQNNTGTVKGSQGRFGFVVLDDGREIYLPAEQMQRVFPDDRVIIDVITGADGKQSAAVESLIESPLRDFTGHYVIRDNAHFVEPDLPRLSRWIFLPPKQRLPIKGDNKRMPQHGDLVRARITRHPHADGKPAARIEALIGTPNDAFIAARYALARFNLPDSNLNYHDGDLLKPDFAARHDLTALPFVTIDNADTRDMDDALHVETRDDGWRVFVAIADPTAWIKPGSGLEQAIAARTNTVYLPGLTVAMLPDVLANERCSLLAGEERLALVCSIDINSDGAITHREFCEAKIRSQAKLSYGDVAAALADTTRVIDARDTLEKLFAVAKTLRAHRGRENLLMPERPDYRLVLDDNGQIADIERQLKNDAQLIVEECMVAANRCAADFLCESVDGESAGDGSALFVCHAGFRSERREPIAQMLSTELPEKSANDTTVLAQYIDLIQALDNMPATAPPLRAILSRWLERSQLATSATPHFGMGLPRYTTFTSPIRKYSDFLVHRAIKARLQHKKSAAITPEQLAQMQERLDRSRQAAHLAEQWLKCVYLQKLPAKTVLPGTIAHINSSGFTVRLDATGIEGFVDTRLLPEKYSFDANTLRLSSGGRVYQLEQPIDVTVSAIDVKKRSINFAMVVADKVEESESA